VPPLWLGDKKGGTERAEKSIFRIYCIYLPSDSQLRLAMSASRKPSISSISTLTSANSTGRHRASISLYHSTMRLSVDTQSHSSSERANNFSASGGMSSIPRNFRYRTSRKAATN